VFVNISEFEINSLNAIIGQVNNVVGTKENAYDMLETILKKILRRRYAK
jgi:hypothetical protein